MWHWQFCFNTHHLSTLGYLTSKRQRECVWMYSMYCVYVRSSLLWLLPAVPHSCTLLFPPYLYLLFTPPPPQPLVSPSSLSLSSGPWHYPSSTTLPTGEPYRLPVSTGTPLLFCWMSPTNGEMTRTKCVVSICNKPKKKGKRSVLSWLNKLKQHVSHSPHN